MSIYIQGIGAITIQPTFQQTGFPEMVWYNQPYVRCIDPDFKSFISPNEIRRMSKVIKRAIATARIALLEAGFEQPDAIISGTGLGCIEDTEKFLQTMIDQEEKFLQPTFFIQSTHNTISSQIAIHLKSHGHNNTFVQGGLSFENALFETLLLFADRKIHSALVGGYDEMTPAYFKLLERIGFWKKGEINSEKLFNTHTPGSMAGEGSVTLALSDVKNENTYACIQDLELIYKPENIGKSVEDFLKLNRLTVQDLDLIITGNNGDCEHDAVYELLTASLFKENMISAYKHFSGEYFTSAGFGFWFAAHCLKYQTIPDNSVIQRGKKGRLQNILLLNHYQQKNYSLSLLTSC